MTLRSPRKWLIIAVVVLPIGSYIVLWVSLYTIAQLVEGWRPAWFGDSSYADIIVLVPDNSPDGFSAALIPIFFLQRLLFLASGLHISHPGRPASPGPGATEERTKAFVDNLRSHLAFRRPGANHVVLYGPD
jgi:hypothetical protein